MIHKNIFITATGTNVGKTVAATVLCSGFKARYWKPIQCGPDLDREFVARWIGKDKIHPGVYEFQAPLSPHHAAPLEDSHVDMKRLLKAAHRLNGPCIIEGAGGLLVPLNETDYVVDFIRALDAYPIVVASTALGTINHTLMTLECLRARALEPLGVILNGEENLKNQDTIERHGLVPIIGRIPHTKEFSFEFFQKAFSGFKWPQSKEEPHAHVH